MTPLAHMASTLARPRRDPPQMLPGRGERAPGPKGTFGANLGSASPISKWSQETSSLGERKGCSYLLHDAPFLVYGG